jgi:hypothetical protein
LAYSASAADLRPEDAASHIGETATVCGVVASAKIWCRAETPSSHAREVPGGNPFLTRARGGALVSALTACHMLGRWQVLR